MSERCYKCFRAVSHCLCKYAMPVDAGVKFVLLMHPKEAKRERTGTGRLTHITLVGSEILVGLDFAKNARLSELLSSDEYFPVLLYPGENTWSAKSVELKQALAGNTGERIGTCDAGVRASVGDIGEQANISERNDNCEQTNTSERIDNCDIGERVAGGGVRVDTSERVLGVATGVQSDTSEHRCASARRGTGSKTLLVLVIDATWFCAKKVLDHSPFLLDLPRISFFGNYTSEFTFKREPRSDYISTIESCYYLIKELQGQGLVADNVNAEPLMTIFRKMVASQIQAQNDRIDGKLPNTHAYNWKYTKKFGEK
ncbi:MAG: DTW domain-containing protein [Treponema sp.]|nr:DTW domain-containing protein [Treponema sp.]